MSPKTRVVSVLVPPHDGHILDVRACMHVCMCVRERVHLHVRVCLRVRVCICAGE